MVIHSYKELIVWQKAIELVVLVYSLTGEFPKEEVFGLVSQMRRCAVSIPSNIAEGRFRGTRKDFLQFLRIAYASGAELETQMEIAQRVLNVDADKYEPTKSMLDEVMRMCNGMIRKLSKPKS